MKTSGQRLTKGMSIIIHCTLDWDEMDKSSEDSFVTRETRGQIGLITDCGQWLFEDIPAESPVDNHMVYFLYCQNRHLSWSLLSQTYRWKQKRSLFQCVSNTPGITDRSVKLSVSFNKVCQIPQESLTDQSSSLWASIRCVKYPRNHRQISQALCELQ